MVIRQVIRLDPDSPSGYERRHAALHRKGDYEDAIVAYETMLSKMSESSNPDIRGESNDDIRYFFSVNNLP